MAKQSKVTNVIAAKSQSATATPLFFAIKSFVRAICIMPFCRDGWDAYERQIEPVFHMIGKH